MRENSEVVIIYPDLLWGLPVYLIFQSNKAAGPTPFPASDQHISLLGIVGLAAHEHQVPQSRGRQGLDIY